MSRKKIGCPACGHLMPAPALGATVKCARCGKPIRVTAKTHRPLAKARAAHPPPDDVATKDVSVDQIGPPTSAKRPSESAAWYYCETPGQETGPVPFENLQFLAQVGEISPETLVRKNAEWKWLRADQVPGLFNGTAS